MSSTVQTASTIGGRSSRPGGTAARLCYQNWKACLLCVSIFVLVGCEQNAGKTRPDDAQVADQGGSEGDETGHDGVGESCSTIVDCSSFLSCIDGSCQIPPAVTGQHDSDTPRVSFIGEGGEEVAQFWVELALTPDEHEKGLMYRREMKDDWGMLFIYPEEGPRSFWMQNTFIPLDMVFMDGQGRIINIIEAAEPLTRVPRRSEGPSRFILELNAGRAAEVGLEPGQQMQVENIDAQHAPLSPQ